MRALALLPLVLALPAVAGPFDGVYRPDQPWAEGWDCKSVGSDGGALAVRDGVFYGVENACQLTNPVEVNGMSAVLYYAECSGEGETYAKRMMLMRLPEGLAVIEDGFVNVLRACQ
jgi:hypothetical protein